MKLSTLVILFFGLFGTAVVLVATGSKGNSEDAVSAELKPVVSNRAGAKTITLKKD